MQSQRTKEGVHAGSVVDDSKYTHQQMQLMKTQDASYVQLKAQVDEKVRAQRHPQHRLSSPASSTYWGDLSRVGGESGAFRANAVEP
jgi:hypothetical protein